MYIFSISINTHFPYMKNLSSSLINFGRRNDENDSFSSSWNKLSNEEKIQKIAEARQKGEARKDTCKKYGGM